jgi:hypothetical protein
MLIPGSRLTVTDNSGAKEVECIKTRGKFAAIGDIITASVKKAGKGKVQQVVVPTVGLGLEAARPSHVGMNRDWLPFLPRFTLTTSNCCMRVGTSGESGGGRDKEASATQGRQVHIDPSLQLATVSACYIAG